MCGICGITEKNENNIILLNDSLSHRGPDGSSMYVADGVSLGHRRLAIIDLSPRATQPMQSADGRFIISYNGEIFNYKELRNEIGSRYTFSSESDTEVLLAAFSVWGIGMLSKLKGIFAFAIWDTKDQALLLCRDHMGVKPLYYKCIDGVLTFASELSSFSTLTNSKINKERLALYLGLNYTPAGETLVNQVHKLPAGHYLQYKDGHIEMTEYFNVFSGDSVEPTSDSIYETIDKAVSRQLVSDRPVGIFLSGGIDSSVVLHHAHTHLEKIKTYSVSYEMIKGAESESSKFNTDAELAARTAAHYGVDHTTFAISITDVRDNLERAIQSLDDPVANPTAIAQYLLSKWVREDGTVVALGGDGGDELFGGYTRHRAMMAAYYYSFIPPGIRDGLGKAHSKFAKLDNAPGLPLHISLMTNKQSNIDQICKLNLESDEAVKKELETHYERAPKGLHPLDQFMRVDRHTWLAEESLTRSDRSSMAHGLEVRVPFLDVDVVRLSDSVSAFTKTTPWTGKKILRETYRNHLPSYLYNQPKRGWISPGAKWFRDPVIYEFCKEVFSSGYHSGLDTIINWEKVQKMLDDHVEKRGYYLQPLWNILVLQIWAIKYNLRH